MIAVLVASRVGLAEFDSPDAWPLQWPVAAVEYQKPLLPYDPPRFDGPRYDLESRERSLPVVAHPAPIIPEAENYPAWESPGEPLPYLDTTSSGHQYHGDVWGWQVLPVGLLYRSYLAGVKEPRLGATFNHETNDGWKWDLAAGGRVGLLRYGNSDPRHGEGWQLDVEGAAFVRLDPEMDMGLEGTDYRFGVPLTYARGRYQMKFAYYHLSSHLGDEYILQHGGGGRINYSRDCLVWGHGYMLTPNLRAYGEAAWAFVSDVAEPWEFQLGLDYSPVDIDPLRGSWFWAVNAHLREENDFSGNLVLQAGRQWRRFDGQRMRVGVQYYNGTHEKYQFFAASEQKIGVGIWYDF